MRMKDLGKESFKKTAFYMQRTLPKALISTKLLRLAIKLMVDGSPGVKR